MQIDRELFFEADTVVILYQQILDRAVSNTGSKLAVLLRKIAEQTFITPRLVASYQFTALGIAWAQSDPRLIRFERQIPHNTPTHSDDYELCRYYSLWWGLRYKRPDFGIRTTLVPIKQRLLSSDQVSELAVANDDYAAHQESTRTAEQVPAGLVDREITDNALCQLLGIQNPYDT